MGPDGQDGAGDFAPLRLSWALLVRGRQPRAAALHPFGHEPVDAVAVKIDFPADKLLGR